MEKIEELEKYKKLLDDGAITEDEFRLMKQKILGLKTDEEKAAEKQAEKIRNITLTIKSKGGDSGKLFGSITSKDIADALQKQENIKVDKKKIVLDSPIKQTGEAEVTVKLFSEVTATLKVNVII